MRDRLFGGFDQRWAYVLLGSSYTDYLFSPEVAASLGASPILRSEGQTDELLREVISAISGRTLLWDQVRS